METDRTAFSAAALSRLEERYNREAIFTIGMMRDVLSAADDEHRTGRGGLTGKRLSRLADLAEDVILHLGFFGHKAAIGAAVQILEIANLADAIRPDDLLSKVSDAIARIEADLVRDAGQPCVTGDPPGAQ